MDEIARAGAAASRRTGLVVGGVIAFHAAALWALQAGLLQRAMEVVVPANILSELIEPPRPRADPPPPPPPPPPVRPPVPRQAQRMAPPAPPVPVPAAIEDPTPAPAAPTGSTALQPPEPPAPVAAAPVAPAPPSVQPPSSDADYLQNPKPAYPPASMRLGEQGAVRVRVLIGVDGTAQQAEIQASSGFPRLDRAALETVKRWRYVPGQRGGVPEAMWFSVPINFVLE